MLKRIFGISLILLSNSIVIAGDSHGHSNSHSHNHSHHHGGSSSTANNCSLLFKAGLQTHGASSSDKIKFSCRAKLLNNPTTVLTSKKVSNPSASCPETCVTTDCSASYTAANSYSAGSFKNYSSHGHHHGASSDDLTIAHRQTGIMGESNKLNYDKVKVSTDAILNITSYTQDTVYKINTLKLEARSTINMVPGDYWIKNLTVAENVNINVVGSGTVRIYVNKDFTIGHNSTINASSNETNPAKQMFIYGYKNVTFNNDTEIVGFIYSAKAVTLNHRSALTGAILAKEITLKEDATVTYDPDAVSELDLSTICPIDISYFKINHGGNGTYCSTQEIMVTAYNSYGVLNDYTGTIVVDTGSGKGTWKLLSGSGTLNDSIANDGIASYTFVASDKGTVKLGLEYTEGNNSIDIEAYVENDQTIRDDDSEGSLEFSQTGFVITANSVANPPPFPVKYNETQTAGIADNLYITAFGLESGVCKVIDSYNGNKTLKIWQDYKNPTTGSIAYKINGNSVGANEATATSNNISFVNGSAIVSGLYRDVGQVQLHVKDNSNSAMRGSTDNFVVRPANFIVNVPNNPAANDATGAIFKKAGESFNVEVTVTDNDGNPTPNYGNELIPKGINIFSTNLVAPLDGRNGSQNDGAIANGSNFSKVSPGVFSGSDFSFDEVGIIQLQAEVKDKDYLGTGNVTGNATGNIGRFVPSHFALYLNMPLFNTGCQTGNFTYLGQNLTYNVNPLVTLTAKELANGTTQNYSGDFWRLGPSGVTATYISNSSQSALDSAAAELDYSINQLGHGQGTIEFRDGGGLKFSKLNYTDIPPFNAELQLDVIIADSDGITPTTNPLVIGGTDVGTGIGFTAGKAMYQGRIFLGNNFGTGQMPILVPFQVNYYNGGAYVLNTNDSCTQFSDNHILLTPSTPELNVTPTVSNFVNGIAPLTLSSGPDGVTGYVDVTADLTSANLEYLQHDWPYEGMDGIHDDNPKSRVTYGIYEGDDNIIYIQEVTN